MLARSPQAGLTCSVHDRNGVSNAGYIESCRQSQMSFFTQEGLYVDSGQERQSVDHRTGRIFGFGACFAPAFTSFTSFPPLK
jgi:hypothetical protein